MAPRKSGRRWDGAVAVVTGASSGIGRRLALDLAARGATVVGLARRAELLHELEAELVKQSPQSGTQACDVADEARFVATLDDVTSKHGRIDVLVNNAGTEQLTPAADGPSAAYRRIFDVNFFGVVTGTLAVLPGMLARGSGIVVNVASDSARAPEPGHGAYSASKAAVATFSESVFYEAARRGVQVHVLYPAWVPTAMGLSGLEDGGKLPPRLVRRSEEQIAALVLDHMGGPQLEINASRLPRLAVVGRAVAPGAYGWAMRRFASSDPSR